MAPRLPVPQPSVPCLPSKVSGTGMTGGITVVWAVPPRCCGPGGHLARSGPGAPPRSCCRDQAARVPGEGPRRWRRRQLRGDRAGVARVPRASGQHFLLETSGQGTRSGCSSDRADRLGPPPPFCLGAGRGSLGRGWPCLQGAPSQGRLTGVRTGVGAARVGSVRQGTWPPRCSLRDAFPQMGRRPRSSPESPRFPREGALRAPVARAATPTVSPSASPTLPTASWGPGWGAG